MHSCEWSSTLLEKLTSLLSGFTDSNIQPTCLSPFSSFQILNPYKASQEFDQPQWKQLYSLLLQTSVYSSVLGDDLNQFVGEELKLQDIAILSDHLFEEVDKQFTSISAGVASKQNKSDILIPLDGLLSLLRCCLVILPLLEFDPCIVSKKCQTLVAIFERTCHLGSILCDSNISNAPLTTNLEELDTSVYSADQVADNVLVLSSVLEVFMDELLKDKHLCKHFRKPQYVSSIENKAFPSVHDFIILEVVCSHFLLSCSSKYLVEKYLDTLFWSNLDSRTPNLTLAAGLTLLRSSIILSVPRMLLAHLVSLVSSCIGINLSPFETKTSRILLSQYISAFELSINLYKQIFSLSEEVNDLSFPDVERVLVGKGYQLSFECCILPVTRDKINFRVHELVKATQPCSGSVNSQALGPHLLSTSAAFIEENQHILDELHRHEICSVLKSVIKIILSSKNLVNAASVNREVSQQEIYVLAAALKLMSCTLLQIVGYIKGSWGKAPFRNLRDYSLCREYEFIIRTIGCFGEYSYAMPVQKALLDGLGMDAVMHKETKLMLIHLAGGMVFAFQSGRDFLWKSCIFMMMALMNLVIFEDGNTNVLRPILVSAKESSCSKLSFAKAFQNGKIQSIALNFQKIQKTIMKERSKHLEGEIKGVPNFEKAKVFGLKNEDENTCNGEYFKCMGNPSDFDDLVDFIACTPGKDYSSWLKKKKRFMQWKERKRRYTLLAKKKRFWNSTKGW